MPRPAIHDAGAANRTLVWTATVSMANPVQIGLAVTSHDNDILASVVFDSVLITPGGAG